MPPYPFIKMDESRSLTGPKIARMLSSLDETLNDYRESMELHSHQENTTYFENIFKKDFKNLIIRLKKLETHFLKTPKYYTH